MRKAAGEVTAILKRMLFIGFSVQIVLGGSWMCFNFFHLQDFGQTGGLLYPMLRKGLLGVYPLIYLGQLGIAACAAHSLLQSLYSAAGFFAVWRVLALLTFPMAAQCHLAISPYSLASSFFLLELSFLVRLCKGESGKNLRLLAEMGGVWILQTLLLPEYVLLGGFPFLLAALFCTGRALAARRTKAAAGVVLLVLAVSGLLCGVCSLSGKWENPYRREELALSLFSRVAWQNMIRDLGAWPEEVREVFGGRAAEIYGYADNVRKVAEPLMDTAFSEEQKIRYYLEMAESSWRVRAPVVIRQIAQDVLGYTFTPVILPMQLEGVGYDSYSGRNYEMLMNHMPRLSGIYVRYSCWWFCIMLVLTMLLQIAGRISGWKRIRGSELSALLGCVTALGLTVVVYSLRGAGLMDYKCTVAMNLFWLTAALWGLHGRAGNGAETAE